jgi:hypothetical protein
VRFARNLAPPKCAGILTNKGNAMTPQIEDRPSSAASAVQHSASTLRALKASRELVELLRACEKCVRELSINIDESSVELAVQIAPHLAAAGELAEVLKYKVQRSVQERSGFWEPADPDASVRRRLARRVRAAI